MNGRVQVTVRFRVRASSRSIRSYAAFSRYKAPRVLRGHRREEEILGRHRLPSCQRALGERRQVVCIRPSREDNPQTVLRRSGPLGETGDERAVSGDGDEPDVDELLQLGQPIGPARARLIDGGAERRWITLDRHGYVYVSSFVRIAVPVTFGNA